MRVSSRLKEKERTDDAENICTVTPFSVKSVDPDTNINFRMAIVLWCPWELVLITWCARQANIWLSTSHKQLHERKICFLCLKDPGHVPTQLELAVMDLTSCKSWISLLSDMLVV